MEQSARKREPQRGEAAREAVRARATAPLGVAPRRWASTLAGCLAALTATASSAGALDDLSIRSGPALCKANGQTGGQRVEIVNANPTRPVLATVRVDADHGHYAFGDAQGRRMTFTYPYSETPWVAPGGSTVLGCASVRYGNDVTSQAYTLVDGRYDESPPPRPDNPADFVGAVNVTRPARCGASNPGLYIINRHPSRTIEAKVGMGGGVIGPMFIPPQGAGPWLGCKYDRAPGPVTIRGVQFTTSGK